MVTLSGTRFGYASYCPKINFGLSAAETHACISESAIVSKSSAGSGTSLQMTASLDLRSVATNAISFFAPVLVGLASNASSVPPVSGSISVSVTGLRFSTIGSSQRSTLGGSSSLATVWISDSSLSHKVASGASRSLSVGTSVSGLVGTISSFVSFSSPAISSQTVLAVAATGLQSVTIIGRNLGRSNRSPVSSIGASTTTASNWVSDSSIVSRISSGSGLSLSPGVSVALLKASSISNSSLSF